MSRQTKRTSAPAPVEIPPSGPVEIPPSGAHSVPPPAIPSMFPGAWFPTCPPQSSASSTASRWFSGVQQAGMVGTSAQVSWWTSPPGIGASASPWSMVEKANDTDLEAWGSDSHPPGGFLNFLKTTPSPTQAASNGSASQAINVSDGDNDGDCDRTEKRLLWTKEEDLRLVSAWLNNSNDPIQANYKKNDQYWKDVTAVYNSTTPKNRTRLVKQVKDRFGRIKKRVAWFCGSWKEANAMWASGESDVDLMERALKSYEEDHRKDGPFMFKHCWDVLRKEPKWDAYLEHLEDLEPDKRKFSVEEDVGQQFSLDDARDERPIGGKKAKEQLKRKKKDQACIIDIEDELHGFLDAQKTANEGRKEMLETQRRLSSEKLESRRLAHLAAKERKEAVMLETYQSLLMQNTIGMPEDVKSEHLLALRCLRESLFKKND